MSGNCKSLMVDTSSVKCKRIPLAPEVVLVAAAEMTELKRIKRCRWLLPYVDVAADDNDDRVNKDADDAAEEDDGANAADEEANEDDALVS